MTRQEQVQQRIDQMPASYRQRYKNAVERKSMRAAVDSFCIECVAPAVEDRLRLESHETVLVMLCSMEQRLNLHRGAEGIALEAQRQGCERVRSHIRTGVEK